MASSTRGKQFVAALYWPTNEFYDDESTIIEHSVEAGGTVEWSKEFGTEHTSGTVIVNIEGTVTGTEKVDVGK